MKADRGRVVSASLVGAVAALVLVLRYMQTEWWQEELLFRATGGVVWHGLIHTIPAVAFASGLPPYLWFVVTVGVVAAIVAARLSPLAGLALALLPFGGVYQTVLNAHWFTGILLALLLVLPRWRVDPLAAAICALNGFAAVILAPLYLLRARRHPLLSAVVLIGAIVQLGVMVTAGRELHSIPIAEGLTASVVRLGMAPLGDMPIVPWLWLLTLPGFAVAVRYLPRDLGVVLVYYSLATAVLGLLTSTTPERLWVPWAESRYLVAAGWTMWLAYGAVLLRSRNNRRVLGAPGMPRRTDRQREQQPSPRDVVVRPGTSQV